MSSKECVKMETERDRDRKLILETMETVLELQLRSVRHLLKRKEGVLAPTRRPGRRRKSLVDLVVEILTSEQRPLHVGTLLELLTQRYGRVSDRDALSSALGKKAGQGGLVRRVAPATFALRQEG
jgi:hypothetical protein